MSGLLKALRGGTRTAALIQKPSRKLHVATIRPGDTHWLTICDRDVIAAGTRFWADSADAGVQTEERAGEVCAHCHRLILLATLLVDRGAVANPTEDYPKVRNLSA